MSVLQGLSFGPENHFDFSDVQNAADVVLREAVSLNAGYYGYEPYNDIYSKHCLGGKAAPNHVFEYLRQFTIAATTAEVPFLAQTEDEELHNDNLLNARMIDEPLTKFLENMESDGRGTDTIIIINADHVPRYGGSQDHDILGHLYNINPVLRVLLPQSLLEKYGEILADNQRVITQSLDLYATLRHLVEDGSAGMHYRTNSSMWRKPQEGKSLFRTIKPNRTCIEAGINEVRCTCAFGPKKIILSNRVGREVQLPNEFFKIKERLKILSEMQLWHLGGNEKILGCKQPHFKQIDRLEVQRPHKDAVGENGAGQYTFEMWFEMGTLMLLRPSQRDGIIKAITLSPWIGRRPCLNRAKMLLPPHRPYH